MQKDKQKYHENVGKTDKQTKIKRMLKQKSKKLIEIVDKHTKEKKSHLEIGRQQNKRQIFL